MNNHILSIQQVFSAKSSPDQAIPMAKYMKNNFPFLGLKRPVRNELQKDYLKKENLPELDELKEIIKYLWELPEREYQYFALDLLYKFKKKVPEDFIDVYEYIIINKSWWDCVDLIAGRLVAEHFMIFPDLRDKYVDKWLKSDNLWLQRTCLLFQLHYKAETDQVLLGRIIMNLYDQDEFFIQKAIGWALREYSKTDSESVINFVRNNPLSDFSKREALKWLDKRKTN